MREPCTKQQYQQATNKVCHRYQFKQPIGQNKATVQQGDRGSNGPEQVGGFICTAFFIAIQISDGRKIGNTANNSCTHISHYQTIQK
jgi:hypothetical protein